MYSVILPYQHLDEREPLFYACLDQLLKICPDFEIIVHEVGPERHLNLPGKCKHIFTRYEGTFHRAWVLNRGAKIGATKDILILMDCDLIITEEWGKEVLTAEIPAVGWGRINCLNKEGTSQYLQSKWINQDKFEKTKTPSRGSAAGAITVIPKTTFFALRGIPEDFSGSWGGEDNAFWGKLTKLGYKFQSFNSIITHLYHTKSTPQIREIQKKALPMLYWNKAQWEEHMKEAALSWGSEYPSKPIESYDYITEQSKAKLSIAMLSWIRPEKLIKTLTSLNEVLTLKANITLMVQGTETLDNDQRRVIRELASRFYRSDVFFTQGNIGTGPARAHLLKRSMLRFPAPYLNFGDDDTTFTPGSVEAAIDLLDSDRSIGMVGIRYKPKIYKLDNYLHPQILASYPSESSIEYVDSTGSASAIIRSEVFSHCKVDAKYKLGQWDLDFCLQLRSVGWKIVNYQAFSGMKAINNWGGSPEYRRGRMNREKINKSITRFKHKWGLVKAV